jgi:hypothetical protein
MGRLSRSCRQFLENPIAQGKSGVTEMIGCLSERLRDFAGSDQPAPIFAPRRHQVAHRVALGIIGAMFGINGSVDRLESVFRVDSAPMRQLHRRFNCADEITDALCGDFGELAKRCRMGIVRHEAQEKSGFVETIENILDFVDQVAKFRIGAELCGKIAR